MFSYRHFFHAGNHADVLKHLTLMAALRHILQKPGPVRLIDTHAGAGSYDITHGDHRPASPATSESEQGVQALMRHLSSLPQGQVCAPLLQYQAVLAAFNPQWTQGAPLRRYPGSPQVMNYFMTEAGRLEGTISRDSLHLFEMHPTDARALLTLCQGMPSCRRVHPAQTDGFAGLLALLPPPAGAHGSRRCLALIDPSYEIKSDYDKVQITLEGALKRFATGVYLIWYPIIGRAQAHQLPRQLRAIASGASAKRRAWLHAQLNVGRPKAVEALSAHPGLSASGMFVINPPYLLEENLRQALPQALGAMAAGSQPSWSVETGQ